MSIFKNKAVQLILFVGFGAGLLYLVYLNQKNLHVANCIAQNGPEANCDYLEKIINDLRKANFAWVALSLCLYLLSNVLRALRWIMLFRPMGYIVSFWNSFFSVMIGYMVNLGLPRAGEVARMAALSRNENIPMEKVAGTVVVDRTMDFVCLFIMIALGIMFEYDVIINFLKEEGKFPIWALFLPIIPIVGLLWFMRIRKTSTNKLVAKINNLLTGFADGLMSVFRMKQKFLFIAYTIGIWLCYYLMTYVVFFSFEPTENLGPASGLVVFVFGALGMVVPSPGGAGSYHYLIAKGLELYGVADGFVLANIIFIPIQVVGNIIFGILSYICLPYLKKTDEVKTS